MTSPTWSCSSGVLKRHRFIWSVLLNDVCQSGAAWTLRYVASCGIVEIDCLQFSIKIHSTGALFLEGIRAGFFDPAERRLQSQAGRNLIYLYNAGLDFLGIGHCLFEIAGDDGGGQAHIEAVGQLQGLLEILNGHYGHDRPENL